MIYKFKYKPGFVVRSKVTGRRLFEFNYKGEYITDDEQIIERAKGHFDYQVVDAEFKTPDKEEFTEEEIRAEAKKQGIKSWHLKGIETLKKEIGW